MTNQELREKAIKEEIALVSGWFEGHPASAIIEELASRVVEQRMLVLQQEQRILRLRARNEWLRDGYREIAAGRAPYPVDYARDTLSGPTEETIQNQIGLLATIDQEKA